MNSKIYGITVVTIVLNGELHIEETILSVVSQKNVKIQYIIIDGGSTDKTLHIIEKYRSNVDIIVSEPDGGIYHAINKGIQFARFDLIGIINCGDFLEPHSLAAALKEFKRTSADVIYGKIRIIEEIRNQNFFRVLIPDHNQLKRRMSVYHPATFVKKECYDLYGLYNPDYRVASDYDLLLKLYIHGRKFIYLPTLITNFRTGGISGQGGMTLIKENFLIRKKQLGRYKAYEYLLKTYPIQLLYSIRRFLLMSLIGQKGYQRLRLLKNSHFFWQK